eukprot:204878_1
MAQKRKLPSDTIENNPPKKQKMNQEEDSDSDFDPAQVVEELKRKKRQHRYQTRSVSLLHRPKTDKESNDVDQEDQEQVNEGSKPTESDQPRRKKRGRPKSKRRKRKSNHIEKTSSNDKKEAIKERLSSMDKYDSQQYILSVVNTINSNEYIHPFRCKPTTLPKRRIIKIMKLEPTQFKMSLIALELMAIVIEIFIRDLISRAYKYTIKDNRKSLQLQDICRAVQSDNMYDFLIDIIPRIQSYDQQSNIYNFIHPSQMEKAALTNTLALTHNSNSKNNAEDQEEEEESNTVRRSKRLRIRRSDKEEASD